MKSKISSLAQPKALFLYLVLSLFVQHSLEREVDYSITEVDQVTEYLQQVFDIEEKIILQDTFTPSINYASQYNVTTFGNAFLRGLNADYFAKNITNCYNRWIYYYYYEIPLLEIRYYYGTFKDNFFNSTLLLSNTSNHLMVCNSAANNFDLFFKAQRELFGNFNTYSLAFFQNLLANILNINFIYNKLLTDSQGPTANITDVYYQLGRILNLLFNVQPITTSVLDENGYIISQNNFLDGDDNQYLNYNDEGESKKRNEDFNETLKINAQNKMLIPLKNQATSSNSNQNQVIPSLPSQKAAASSSSAKSASSSSSAKSTSSSSSKKSASSSSITSASSSSKKSTSSSSSNGASSSSSAKSASSSSSGKSTSSSSANGASSSSSAKSSSSSSTNGASSSSSKSASSSSSTSTTSSSSSSKSSSSSSSSSSNSSSQSSNDTYIKPNSYAPNYNYSIKYKQTGWAKILTFAGLMNASFGFFDGAQVTQKENNQLQLCQQTINQKWIKNAYLVVNNTLDGETFVAINNFLDIVYNINTVSLRCYNGYYVAGQSLQSYVQIYKNPKFLSQNIIYNFGEIYFNLRDFAMFMEGNARGNAQLAQQAGYAIGQAFYYTFQPPEEALWYITGEGSTSPS